MQIYVKTDKGKIREINEDSYCIEQTNKFDLYIVADGMGGYNGGEVASQLAIDSAKKYIKNNFNDMEINHFNIQELIRSSIEYANMIVYEKSINNKELEGMGTTFEICLIYNNKLYIGHIGDSRIYRIRKNIMRKLTTDHSYVEKLLKEGNITKEEAKNHPKKNMITKALGCGPYVEPDIMIKGFLKDDILLITSDGLTNMLNEKEIYNIINKNIDNATEELVNCANDLGGYDNITIIIVYNN